MSVAAGLAPAATSTPPWRFASSPDWFNQDVADLSGSTPGVPEAEGWSLGVSGGLNGISPQMVQIYDVMLGEIATYQPELFTVAGDLINGRWFNDVALSMFDPDTRQRSTTLNQAADIYYPWYRWLFAKHGISPVLGVLGDHELGDNDWPVGTEKALYVQTLKRAFGRNMVDVLGLPAQINGAAARPYGTAFEAGSYAYQHRNVLFITVDLFRQDDPNTTIHLIHGSVSPEVSGVHLGWLASLLSAADQDPSIDHVILQGHAPVLRPVRMHSTSGMMVVARQDSGFWQLLRQHDHRHGGKVRLYFSGEVHAVTASKDPQSDLVQLVHGDPPWGEGRSNYVLFTVWPDRIEAESRQFQLYEDGTSLFWQTDEPVSSGPSAVVPSSYVGSLFIDTSAAETHYEASGDLALMDQTGLTLHFGFDQTTPTGTFSNTGSIGNDFYEGIAQGALRTAPGLFGSALQLDGISAFLESGRGNPTEGESRSASAWIKTTATRTETVLSYGADRAGLNGRFNFQLSNGRPRLNIAPDKSCLPEGAPSLADGNWHQIAVVLNDAHENRCADVRFHIDGAEYPTSTLNSSAPLTSLPWRPFRIGVDMTAVAGFFSGSIDDVAVWGSPLSRAKARAIATAGRHAALRYDALAMESLFDLFDAQAGEVTLGDLHWTYTTGLEGTGGDVLNLGDQIAIQLDESGNGVAADISSIPSVYEAELANMSPGFLVSSEHPGFTGIGYVDYVGEGYVQWTVDESTGGTYALIWRYALGGGNRPLRITVDGVTVSSSLDFPATGSWDSWGEVQVPVTLSPGTHTIRAQSIGLSGPNVDHLRLEVQSAPPSDFVLLCSADSTVNGDDLDCAGGTFTDGLWVYLWPESDVSSVDFYLDGIFHRTERLAPYELDGGAVTNLSPGSHTVRAVVHLADGATQDIAATFTAGAAPSSYSLLCSSDSVVDGRDTACNGGAFNRVSHPAGIWVYLWPEDDTLIDYVDYRLNGILQRRENFAPWELLGGAPLALPASQTSYTVTSNLGLFSGTSQPGPAAVFVYGP